MTDLFGPMDAPNAVTSRPSDTRTPGSTDTFWKDCSNSAARDGTPVTASQLNQFAANARALARGNGLKLDGLTKVLAENNANDALLLQSVQHLIQRGRLNFATFTGSVNAFVASLSPAPAELIDGFMITGLSLGANTSSTVTVTINGAATNVVRADGSALQLGDVAAAPFHPKFIYDATSNKLMLQNPALGFCAPRANRFLAITSTQSITVPSWATCCRAQGWGGGGGGGGAVGSGAAASGGGAGGFFDDYISGLTPGQSITCAIGASGGGGNSSGGNGTAGGSTSFGSFATAGGGSGGAGASSAISGVVAIGASATITTGTGIALTGANGSSASGLTGHYLAGRGGAPVFFPAQWISSTTGSPAYAGAGGFYGGGGGGAAGNGAAGGPGGQGLIIVEFFQ